MVVIRKLLLSSESTLTGTQLLQIIVNAKKFHRYYDNLYKTDLCKCNQDRIEIWSWRVQVHLLSLFLNKVRSQRKQDRGSKLSVVTFNLKWILFSEQKSYRRVEKGLMLTVPMVH